MEFNSETKKYFIIGGILLFVVLTFVYAGFTSGQAGIQSVMSKWFKFLFIMVIIGVLGFIFYTLFIMEKRIDAPFEVKKEIMEESKINKTENLKSLYVSGDKKHKSRRIGKIIGWSSRQNMSQVEIGTDKKPETTYTRESVFMVNVNLFKNILVRCPETYHDELQGDVYIKDIALVRHKHFYYPSALHNDYKTIDLTQWEESKRWIFQDIPAIFHPLLKHSLGLSKSDAKEVESKRMIDDIKNNNGDKK